MPNEYTSKIPPRSENCATSSTIGTRSKPMRSRCSRELARLAHVALAQLDAKVGERAGQPRALQQRARRREQHANLAAAQPLERLDALAGDFDVRLGFAESFARRIERDRRLVEQRVQVGEQALGLRHAVGGDDEKARRKTARERGDERSIRGAGQTGDAQLARRERAVY